jgi:hypothetical protein
MTEKKTAGDVLRLYVTPPADTFPWIKIHHHPEGIRRPGVEVDALDAVRDRAELARMLGEAIIGSSPILTAWTQE